MRAKEYFEGIRDEVVKTEQARDMLERLKAKEGVKAQSYQGGSWHGDVSDPMDGVSRRIDFEGRLSQRIKDAEEAIDEALIVLYGADGRGGLSKLKGTRYADAICMAYLQAQEWAEIADIMRCSQQWCRELCNAGFSYIDRVGWAKVKTAD